MEHYCFNNMKRKYFYFLLGLFILVIISGIFLFKKSETSIYGIYRVGEQIAGQSGLANEIGLNHRYYVIRPEYTYLFSDIENQTPIDVPIEMAPTDYKTEICFAEVFTDFPSLQLPKNGIKYSNFWGDTSIYSAQGNFWIYIQVGLAKGGQNCVCQLEKISEDEFFEIFKITADDFISKEEDYLSD